MFLWLLTSYNVRLTNYYFCKHFMPILCNWNAWFNLTCTSLPLSSSPSRPIHRSHIKNKRFMKPLRCFLFAGSFITIKIHKKHKRSTTPWIIYRNCKFSFSPFSYQFNLVGLREWELNFHGPVWKFIDHARVLLKWSINGTEIILMADNSRSNKCLNFILAENRKAYAVQAKA